MTVFISAARLRRIDLAAPPAVLAFVAYLGAALALFGQPLFDGPNQHCICLGYDEGIFVWAFAWWPHALVHGLNPFDSQIIYAPQGFDIAHGALVPAAAMLFWPLTAAASPLASYSVAMLLCPVLAACFAFLLCRRLTGHFWASLFGGWVFGFSPYMLGGLAGHMQVTLVFLIPALVHLVLRGLDGDIGNWALTALLTLALLLQFGFSPEVFVSFTLFGLIALVLTYTLGDRAVRVRVRHVLVPIGVSYFATAVLSAPYLYYAFKPGALPILLKRTNLFSNDLLAFVVPQPDILLGGTHFASTSQHFTAGWIEGGAYLGLPLLAMVLLAAWRFRHRLGARVAVITMLIVAICSLGGKLHVNGPTNIPLPWAIGHRLPVLGLALPSRFVVYVFLIAAVLGAMWFAKTRHRLIAWGLAAASVAFLAPAVGQGYWRGTPDLPSLFTSASYRSVIKPSDTALLLPVGGAGNSMLWQAEAGLRYPMASGYVVPPEAPDPYKREPIYPTLTAGVMFPHVDLAARSFLLSHGVTVAVVDPTSAPAKPWVGILERLGWGSRTIGGAIVLRPRR